MISFSPDAHREARYDICCLTIRRIKYRSVFHVFHSSILIKYDITCVTCLLLDNSYHWQSERKKKWMGPNEKIENERIEKRE
jgi:hypothetical protein